MTRLSLKDIVKSIKKEKHQGSKTYSQIGKMKIAKIAMMALVNY
jgi:hypothetical protein